MQPSKGLSQTGDRIGRDKSEHIKDAPSEGHSLPGDQVGRDKSGHEKFATRGGKLTPC